MKLQSRRIFIRNLLATTAVVSTAPYLNAANWLASETSNGKIPTRPLGKTGFNVGIYSLGAQATVEQLNRTKDAVAIVNRCIDLGINYIDTAAWYGQDGVNWKDDHLRGTSEKHVGMVMKTRRKEVFLATKTHLRSYDDSMRLLENSLKNLQTDHIDLWQIHNIAGNDDENIDKIFAKDGVLKAMEKAKSEGIIKYTGITGHKDPAPMKKLIERYPFDNVLMALNAADKHHNSFIEKLLPTAIEKEMGIVGMKIPARDRIFSNGGIISMKEAMSYTLSLPVSTIIVGLDNIQELEENVKIAKAFKQLSTDEMLAIEEKVKPHKDHLMFYKGLSEWPEVWSGNNF